MVRYTKSIIGRGFSGRQDGERDRVLREFEKNQCLNKKRD